MRPSRGLLLFDDGVDFIGHVEDFLEEPGLFARNRDLFRHHIGEEPVFEIVMCGGAQRMYVRIGAVVIGDQQAFVGYHASGAAEIQRDYGVLDGNLVRVIDFSGLEFQTGFLHLPGEGFRDGVHHPHPFVCHCDYRAERQQYRYGQSSCFHNKLAINS